MLPVPAPSTFPVVRIVEELGHLQSRSPASGDLVSVESSADLPELDDADVIADGGTEVMRRDPSLTAAATAAAAPLPPAPVTAPMLDVAPDDHEEQQRRIDRTQPFDRASIFGVKTPAPPAVSTQPSANWPIARATARPTSIAPIAMDIYPSRAVAPSLPAAPFAPSTKPSLAIAAAVGGAVGLVLCAAVAVTMAVRSHDTTASGTSSVAAARREAQTVPARAGEVEVPQMTPETLPTVAENDVPVISPEALPSAPTPPRMSAGSKKRSHPTGR